jgi:hypothetical protein
MTAPWHFAGSGQLCIQWQEGTECYRVQRSDGRSTAPCACAMGRR